jgi:hypothetical protein
VSGQIIGDPGLHSNPAAALARGGKTGAVWGAPHVSAPPYCIDAIETLLNWMAEQPVIWFVRAESVVRHSRVADTIR